jgi:hypothetical protein
VFLLRWGSASTSCQDRALLIPHACERAPASIRQKGDESLDFKDWAGPTLPHFSNHVGDHNQREVDVPSDLFPAPRHVPAVSEHSPDPLGFGTASTVTVPPPLHLPTAQLLPHVGAKFTKDFGHHGKFVGEIVSYDEETQLCHAECEDGDAEDFTITELLVLWHPSSTPRTHLSSAPHTRQAQQDQKASSSSWVYAPT